MFINIPANFSKLIVIAFSVVVLQACGPGAPGVYKGDKIPSGMQSKLHGLNDDLLGALKENNNNTLEGMMSREMISGGHERMRLTEQISNHMKLGDYVLSKEYYIVNQFRGLDTIKERSEGINNFNLIYERTAPQMYFAFFRPKTNEKWQITALFCKLDYGWKLCDLELNLYADNGRTAADLITLSKQQIAKGEWLDAFNNADMAQDCLRPYTKMEYLCDEEVSKNYNLAMKAFATNLSMPIVINQLPGKPVVIRVLLERNADGAFPNINYLTNLDLNDVKALTAENQAVQKVIGNVFKGVDKDKKYIYYTIYHNKGNNRANPKDHTDMRQVL